MMAPMTRARTASSGMGSLAAIQPLLAAVLMLCVSLVQAAATTLRMILNRKPRDWHTGPAQDDPPQATSGTHLTKDNSTHESCSAQCRASLLAHRSDSQAFPATHATRTLKACPLARVQSCRAPGMTPSVCRHP
jgi:hypothetical protein